MDGMHETLMRLIQEEDGLEMVEWGVAAVLIIVAAATTVFDVGNAIATELADILARLSA
jgi:Flp pilus assembly pilin Flp